MFIQTVMASKARKFVILSKVLSECIRSKASIYLSKTDVNSNSAAVGTTDLRLANWFANVVSKTTSRGLY